MSMMLIDKRRRRGDPTLTLNLDFTATALNNQITFVRATAATDIVDGVVIHYSSGQPRITVQNGFLKEGQRINLAFQNSIAAGTGTSVSGSQSGPDGLSTASLVTEDTANSTHTVGCNTFTPAASTAYHLSAFVKAGTCDRVQLFVGTTHAATDCYANFYLNGSGSVSASGAGASGTFIIALSGGWYRIGMNFTSSGTPGSNSFGLSTLVTGSETRVPTFVGTSRTFTLYGLQYEAGIDASSYIPTTTANVTRNADEAYIDGAAFTRFYNASQGTVVCEYNAPRSMGTTTRSLFSINDTTTSNRVRSYLDTNGVNVSVSSGGSIVYAPSAQAATYGSAKKVALGYQVNNFRGARDNSLFTLDTAGAVPVSPTRLCIGSNHTTTGESAFAYIRSLKYFRTRKTDAEIQQLSA